MDTWTSHSEAETIAIGQKYAEQNLRLGTVVCVRGELGAGKTHFIKGVARALGIPAQELTSPTFALAHEFECLAAQSEPWKPRYLNHLDCYRFENPEELLQLGVEDYFYPTQAATIVEWPERIASFLPTEALQVEITVLSETERRIRATP